MKSILSITLTALGMLTMSAIAEDEHEHHEKIAGPNGGRVVTSVEPHLEFFRTKDGKIQITFVDDEGKKVAVEDQEVIVTGGSRSNPTKLTFEKKDDVLISDKPFPEGKNLPVVLQVKTSPDAKPVFERFQLNLSECPTCEHLEYACVCEHEHDHD